MLEEFRNRMKKEMEKSGYTAEVTLVPEFEMSQLRFLEVDGVDMADYPDFVDSYITGGCVLTCDDECRELTEDEIDYINNVHPEIAQIEALEYVY
jgi:hypothetical protein